MQEQEEIRSLSEPQLCEITNRIMIVSPRPASLRTLVAELALRCYDVLLLHHADDPLLGMVPGTIIVLDRTGEIADAAGVPALRYDSGPVLSLVSADAASSQQIGQGHHLQWPCPIDQVIGKILELAATQSPPLPILESHFYAFRDLLVDTQRMTVTQAGNRIVLTKMEYDLLRSLIAAQGKVMSRQELMSEIWGEQYFGGSNAVDVHIRSLRQKLGDDPKEPRYIATVRGAGYRLADS